MTTFLLIRHALCDPVGHSIAGRRPGVHLNTEGRQQAVRLAERLSGLSVVGLYSSPLERAIETAGPIAHTHGLEVQPAPGFVEVDFGDWTGRSLAELEPLPQWRSFNQFRSGTRIPGGETMGEVLTRSLKEMERLGRLHSGSQGSIVVVSHGDVLRMLLTHALGMATDLLHRLELSPASVSVLQMEEYGPRILLLNSTQGWPAGVALKNSR
jgi:probable phosphomutase (TIGR03848 family)